ncbi:RNA polymerase sigma-54 factor [Treponema primitia ZAS-2]|uniref:RNA polymerase sigma-54 factor n=1 Tax=Treponema primitia (strain ATCC BAA-887 / DSM 12427 / ZAS-2) TaxID=545694 RepID=F5YQK4_TREPZ|nr:RNA polymerase factor sigma-54 [Treponema primitia]AEF84245.1 RNA polymerase sigma-54 factor [Treponema primitia ZAS-2]
MQLQRPSFIQEQRLKMNPQQIQSIKMMGLPIMDLREKIEEEVERNPALEVVADHTVLSLDEAYVPRKEENDYFETSSDSGFVSKGGDEESAERHKFLEGALSRPETLQEHLLWQLRLEIAEEPVRRIGERLIQNLDENGFHKEPLDALLKENNPAYIVRALAIIRSLDPVGTCTADYRESLRVQAELLPAPPPGIIEALDYLEQLERGKIAEVARKLARSEAEVLAIFEQIKELSPFPGRRFASDNTRYVVPDVQVIKKEGEFVIILNDEEIPVLGLNPFFMKISGEKGEDKSARDFVRENIKEARWFIQSINERNHTLLRVSRAIVEFQRAFFVNGPRDIAPLTLRDIAQELGLNESTISRAARGKYMQTEWGIFEIRHFFTNSISGTGSDRSRYSKEGVKEIIRELISTEGKHSSDQEIAELLARQGIPLARRTVAKYRNELDLGSSYTR